MHDLEALLSDLPAQTFGDGDVIISESAACPALFFLETGSVRVVKDGVEIARVREPGAVFGEMSLFLDEVATASVVADGQAALRRVDDPASYLKRNPDAMFYVAGILAMRLDRLNRYLVDIKEQFADRDDHLGMVDEVLDALMAKHPRKIARRAFDDH